LMSDWMSVAQWSSFPLSTMVGHDRIFREAMG
jgi:hypothetical protein